MNRLLEIGFEPAGHWQLLGDALSFELFRHGSQRNILYAFVSDGEVKYVGKTVRTLRARMHGYKSPAASQSTNLGNNARIKELLLGGAAVDILALPDNGLLHYGQFHLNLAAGLEDNILSVLRPPWNGGRKEAAGDDPPGDEIEPRPVDTFEVILQPTYFRTGFFNVPADYSQSFADDGQSIEIFCGDATSPIMGSINRRANSNGSPRIMGGRGLRDWFQSNMIVMQQAAISVYTPNTIRIDVLPRSAGADGKAPLPDTPRGSEDN